MRMGARIPVLWNRRRNLCTAKRRRWEDEMTAALARGDLEAAKVAAQKHAKAYHRTMAVIGVERYSDFE
jgi:hypothetical protein